MHIIIEMLKLSVLTSLEISSVKKLNEVKLCIYKNDNYVT